MGTARVMAIAPAAMVVMASALILAQAPAGQGRGGQMATFQISTSAATAREI